MGSFFRFSLIPVICLLLSASLCMGEIYTWTDSAGVLHYSDSLPASGGDSKTIREIKGNLEASEPVLPQKSLDDENMDSSGKVYSRRTLVKSLKLKTREQVFRYMGKTPDLREDGNWVYKRVTRNLKSGKWESIILKFGNHRGKDRAVEIEFFEDKNQRS